MGLMDKVKAQAEVLAERAQQGIEQGKEKLEEVQAKRARDALMEQLGNAAYAAHRGEGTQEEVTACIAAIDAHDAARAAALAADAAGSATVPAVEPPTTL